MKNYKNADHIHFIIRKQMNNTLKKHNPKTAILICAGLLLLATEKLQAQDNDWNHIGMEDVISKDSFTQKGYTLILINKQQDFDSTVKQKLMETFFTVYPKEAKLYNKNTLRKVIFVIDPAYKGVAATDNGLVRFNPEWFVKHPKDIDVVTHEVMHIVQSYHDGETPGWLTEGIADYVRAKFGVDNPGAGWTLPAFSPKQNYTDAYRVTARFLLWAEKKHDKKLVQQLDAALRAGTYKPDLWKTLTGKTVDELWKEYAGDPAI